ncbi:MAG: flagellar hook-length control protein FliK, partial [Sphingobium sp.]
GRNAVRTTLDGVASAVPTPEKTAYGAQSILSTLHRATVAEGESKTDTATTTSPAASLSVVGAVARRDSGQASDQGADRDTGGSLRGDDARPGAIAPEVTAGGSQYADILQNLPPIAQSRIGLVGDAAPTAAVGASVDVGASLQGQVIDMSVGGQWIDRVAAEITALASGNGHSRFQLSPPNLGRIQIDLWQGEDGGRVQVLTETDEAARQLRDGQSSLQADARLAALQLNSISIDKAATGFDTPPDQQQTPQQPAQQPGRHQGSEQQGSAQSGSQTPSQGGNGQNGGQTAQQAALQSGMQGGNNGGQGKSSSRRDVLNHQADIVDRQGSAPARDGDRLVRYA